MKQLTDEQKDEAVKLMRKGIPFKFLETEYGTTRQTLWKIARQNSLPLRRLLVRKTCPECNVGFISQNAAKRKYCSIKCYHESRNVCSKRNLQRNLQSDDSIW